MAMTLTGKHWFVLLDHPPTDNLANIELPGCEAMACGYRAEPKTSMGRAHARSASEVRWVLLHGGAKFVAGRWTQPAWDITNTLLYAVDGRLTLHGMSPPCGSPLSPAGRPTPQRLHIPIMLEFVSSCPRLARNSCKFMTAGRFWKFGCCRSLVCTMVRS